MVWTRTYNIDNDDMRSVQALALNPSETELIGYMSEEQNPWNGERKFWMLRVRVEDGMRSSSIPFFEQDDSPSPDLDTIVKSQGMLWTHTDRVYVAF